MLRAYFYKLSKSVMFLIAILGVAAVCFTRFTSYISTKNVCGQFDLLLCFDTLRKVIAIFGALPFAANFSVEWNNSASNMYITRCGTVKYAVSNVIMTFISSFITVFTGMLIFAGVMSCFMPFCVVDQNTLAEPFGFFLGTDFPFLYIAARAAIFAASCAMWSVMGLTLSAFFPNKYVALCAPFAASYIVERITIQFPSPINLWTVSISMLKWDNQLMLFLYSIGLFTALAAILGIVFVLKVKRMVQNEIR